MVVSLVREHDLITKQLNIHMETAGEAVVWYEFLSLSSGGSTYDPVYDESSVGSGGKTYGPPLILPTVYVEEIEDTNRAIDRGRQPVQNVKITASMRKAVLAGLSEPWEYQQHLNDMFLYDGRFYIVTDYRARGRLREEVMLLIEGQETYIDQEHVNDVLTQQTPFVQDYPWPSTLPIHV